MDYCPACATGWSFDGLCAPCRETCAWPDCGRRLPSHDDEGDYPLLSLAALGAANLPIGMRADARRLCAECLRFRYRHAGRSALVCPTCGSSSCDARFGGLLGDACTSACDDCARALGGRSDVEMIECTHRRRRVRAASLAAGERPASLPIRHFYPTPARRIYAVPPGIPLGRHALHVYAASPSTPIGVFAAGTVLSGHH